jgi:asparagine synthase (glutamine-hydrolysing)
MNGAAGCFDPDAADTVVKLSGNWTALPCDRGVAAIAGQTFGSDRMSGNALLDGTVPCLDGHYALVAHDETGHRLVLARDPAGSVSLFWHQDRTGCIRFATRLDALLDTLPEVPALSTSGLDEYLRFLDIAAPNTIYDGVHALEAGQAIEFGPSGARTLKAAGAPIPVPDVYADACDEVETRLCDAISRRLVDSTSAAAFLSGGIDSALLCALARHRGQHIEAFTVGFDAPDLDESPTAARIARHLGIRHHVLRPDADALAATFERAHALAEQPYCDPAGMPTRLAFEACAGHADCVLDGTGAEALPGEMPPRWRRVAHDWVAPWPPGLRRMTATALRTLPGIAGYARLFAFEAPQDLFIRWHGFSIEDIARLTGHVPDLSGTHFYRSYTELRNVSPLKRQSVLQGLALPDDRIRQAALATGLRVEQPFAAPDVSQLLQALPEDWCWQPDRPKRLLRDLLARHVPEAIWNTPKRGFNIDLVGILRSHDHRLVREYLCDATDLARLPLDTGEVVRWRDRFIAGDDSAAHRVWGLLNLSAWLSRRRSAASALA